MRLILLVAFIVFPLVEIALLVKLGAVLGFWPAFGLIVVTAIVGTSVLRSQGFAVLRRCQEALAQGRPPIEPVVDGFFLLVAGLLLIAPGLITDSLGVGLLVPPVRRAVARWSLQTLRANATVGGGVFSGPDYETGQRQPQNSARPGSRRQDAPIIEGDYERVDDPTGAPPPGSNNASKQPRT